MSYNYLTRQPHVDKNSIQAGAINLLIELQIREGYQILDISTATVKNIILEKPDSTVVVSSGSFVTDGKDGLIYYRTSSTDLLQAGTYNVQAYIEMPDFKGYSTPVTFIAQANIPLDNN